MRQEQARLIHLPELNSLAYLQAEYLHQTFSRHTHEGFCIGVIDDGAQQFYRTGSEHIAPKGDIIIVNADEVHTGSSAVESGWAYQAIYPTPEYLQTLTRDLQQERGSTPWFPDAVIHDPGLSQQLLLLFSLLEQPNNFLLKESLLLSTMAMLILRYSKTRIQEKPLSATGQRLQWVSELMNDAPENEFSLNTLAEMVNLSPWHFLRQFKKEIGMTPHAWLIQARIRKARQLLSLGHTLSDVTQLCGFSDQSHFHRHFKNAIGVTPGNYLKGLRLSSSLKSPLLS